MFLLAFYVICVLIAIAVAVFIFQRLKSRGVGRAVVASGIGVAFLFLFFPILVHGGFTFPVEIMLAELRSESARARASYSALLFSSNEIAIKLMKSVEESLSVSWQGMNLENTSIACTRPISTHSR